MFQLEQQQQENPGYDLDRNIDNQINTSFSLSETNSKTSAKLKISTREIYGQRQRQDYMAKISSRFF
ncbi:hypothetical protein DERP_013136 [Dermatophagoides pteronyssinus]|uniref:Uncharacterized protein n=1 Tax=Dermatophagoides pteronyssinus TaxID=6956 RepID=A0ABQ8J5P2_DERPT|nr:hypothetical protein DERP_013136 [Dermatophagoides pteronyssinus]